MFDTVGRLHVLEFIDGAKSSDPYRGKTGRLTRLEPQGARWATGVVLLQDLPFPTALLIDGQDRIYVSVRGAFSPPNGGLVLRFDDLAQRTSSASPIEFAGGSP